MSDISAEQIMNDLARILRNFHGREYSESIDRDTRFFADLGLASIDAVVLGETLETLYARKLPFGELMAELGKTTDRDMRLGDLADYLQRHMTKGV